MDKKRKKEKNDWFNFQFDVDVLKLKF